MANPSIKQQLNDLIAQVISKQIGDPMHKDEWEEVRRVAESFLIDTDSLSGFM